MTEQTVDPRIIAEALYRAEADRVPVAPPTVSAPALDLDTAYAIQRVNIERRLDRGEKIVGHKIGLTSLAMQKQLGVDQPDFGVITDRMVVDNNGALDVDALIAPRVEAEFAFRIGTALPVSPSLDELRAAVDGVAVALEIIDSRVADWKITLIDTVADNASSARIVCGAFTPATSDLLASLPAAEIALLKDGEEIGRGPGSAVLGDPLVSLHWLATAIGVYGEAFAAGEVVLAGAVAAAVPLVAGVHFFASSNGLETVALHTPPARRQETR